MFLMKFASDQQSVTSKPMFSSYQDLVDFQPHSAAIINIKDSATLPILDQAASIKDDTSLPEGYSPSLGPLDAKRRYFSYLGDEPLFAGDRTMDVIAKAKKMSKDKIKSDRAKLIEYLTQKKINFFTSMQTLSSSTNPAIEVKIQAISAALDIYFNRAFRSLQHAKSSMQEKILKAHTDTLGNKPLNAFEYAIMCCLSKLDFLFDKSITNLSSKQKAYMQALAKDDVSGEDKDLYNEIPNYIEQYTAIIETIENQVIELIAENNAPPLATKFRETIQQFQALNAEEKINKPIYTVAEIAMQAYCTSLVKNPKVREFFINDTRFNLNSQQSMNLLRRWIHGQEFLDPQSKLRHEIWGFLFKEPIDDLDILSCVQQSLGKALKHLSLQLLNDLSACTDLQLSSDQAIPDVKDGQQPPSMLFAFPASTESIETKNTEYSGFRRGFLL